VGIGASAGGLEPIESFLAGIRLPTPAAYVVVQHLDPTQEALLAGILARRTAMPVVEAADRMAVEAGHVYVIPPGRDLTLERGRLRVRPPAEERGLRLPIDRFLRSLAADRGPRAIGVILSGMGSDGTLGLRAIREHGGVTLAQEPESALFDAMPRSAIEAGAVDIVAPAAGLPDRVAEILGMHAAPGPVGAEPGPSSGDPVAEVLELVRRRTGVDLSLYKRSTIDRRLERRLGIHGVTSVDAYLPILRANPDEAALLFRELLVGVTSFFRDPATWASLAETVLPALLADLGEDRVFRAWVPACSTGEEAYTLAIVLIETLERVAPRWGGSIQIFATDLDPDAIDRARRGLYPAGIEADLTPERLRRFFVAEDGGWRVGREIRSRVVFATHDATRDPAFTRLDLVSCRNLLIYLGPDLQRALLRTFHHALRPGGLLVLGSAETAGPERGHFTRVGSPERIYRRTAGPGSAPMPERSLPSRPERTHAPGPPVVADAETSIRAEADRILLERFTPAAVVTNGMGDIVYIHGRTGDYLEPAAGRANWNIHAMARDGLRLPLAGAFRTAVAGGAPVVLRAVELGSGAEVRRVDVTVSPVTEPGPLLGMTVIVFAPTGSVRPGRRSRGTGGSAADGTLADELRRASDELEVTRREMRATVEALTGANEELQSTNEELQSTNEELTTSREEMQSMNEELQVVNAELNVRLEELTLANSDMENLLNSTELATIFLDGSLAIRRFTPSATSLFHLIPGDIGRPLGDITSELDDPALADETEAVLRTLRVRERSVRARDGRSFDVRIVPYRTAGNVIDGVVITFTEMTRVRRLESELAAARAARPVDGTDGSPR